MNGGAGVRQVDESGREGWAGGKGAAAELGGAKAQFDGVDQLEGTHCLTRGQLEDN